MVCMEISNKENYKWDVFGGRECKMTQRLRYGKSVQMIINLPAWYVPALICFFCIQRTPIF
jgi:hypothetical protein